MWCLHPEASVRALPRNNQADSTNYFPSESEESGRCPGNSGDPVRSQQRCLGADAQAGDERKAAEGGGLSQQQARLG